MNEFRVYTMKLARYLTDKGFKYIRTSQDVKKPDFINWHFEDTPELRACVEEYAAALVKITNQ